MVPAPSSAAIRRIDTAVNPSVSAIANAVDAIWSRVNFGRREPGSGRVQIRAESSTLAIRTPYR
jgi:hypothetical protein